MTCLLCHRKAGKGRRFCDTHKIPANRPADFVRPPGRGRNHELWFVRRYGITLADRDQLIEEQGGKCAACGENAAQVVDHCHDGGHVRGVLCRRCNVAMIALDDPELLRALWLYKFGMDLHQSMV